MLHFMIDYENTGNSGLQGASYLDREDSITIFYSKTNYSVERRKLQEITDSNCELSICKLKKAGKNALDFYIASRIGELYGGGYHGTVIIVSNDKGFEAVRDYWKNCTEHPQNVIVRSNIEKGILASNENTARFTQIKSQLENVNLEQEFLRYEERNRIKKALEDCFGNTKYHEDIEKIQNILQEKPNKKIVYLNSLKKFGKKDGLIIYAKVKQLLG